MDAALIQAAKSQTESFKRTVSMLSSDGLRVQVTEILQEPLEWQVMPRIKVSEAQMHPAVEADVKFKGLSLLEVCTLMVLHISTHCLRLPHPYAAPCPPPSFTDQVTLPFQCPLRSSMQQEMLHNIAHFVGNGSDSTDCNMMRAHQYKATHTFITASKEMFTAWGANILASKKLSLEKYLACFAGEEVPGDEIALCVVSFMLNTPIIISLAS